MAKSRKIVKNKNLHKIVTIQLKSKETIVVQQIRKNMR